MPQDLPESVRYVSAVLAITSDAISIAKLLVELSILVLRAYVGPDEAGSR